MEKELLKPSSYSVFTMFSNSIHRIEANIESKFVGRGVKYHMVFEMLEDLRNFRADVSKLITSAVLF